MMMTKKRAPGPADSKTPGHAPAAFYAFFLFLLVSPALGSANTCVTAECHSGLIAKSTVHEPVAADCLSCHQRKIEEHPAPGGKTFALVAEGAALCASCHEEKMAHGKYGHDPEVMGNCVKCHDVHSSDQLHLLRQKPQELCLGCHDEIGEKMQKAKTRHAPLYRKEACGSCHRIHSGDRENLLLFTGKELCLSCHGKDNTSKSGGLKNIKKELAGKKHLHGPVADGQCSACHDPHGSAYPRLLTGAYPAGIYANYEPGIYDFCFGCHDKNLLRSRVTTSGTQFRNGNNNLHYVHSATKLKGRTCRTCHEPHAGDGDKLISGEGASFGSWNIPVRFVSMPNGGSCSPGCHQTKGYDRVQPVTSAGEKVEGGKE